MSERRFIETHNFPVEKVNQASAGEKKGGGRPPHWEMVFWWTRKPLAGARAVIAAALLEADAYQNAEQFLNDLFPCRRERKTVHACNPSKRLVERLRGKRLLDPFAGFGSIPLEALRLGMDVTAVELLPTAYVFLKAVLEYPKKYGGLTVEVGKEEAKRLGIDAGKIPALVYDVAKWGRWILDQLAGDPDIKELYDGGAAVYIGTWEVKCPVCGRHTPLVGNWWLARVKKGSAYERLAWMEWKGGVVVTDLNEECRKSGKGGCDELVAKVSAREGEGGGSVEWSGRRYVVPQKNIDARRETAQCLHCRAEINHRVVNGRIVKAGKKEGDWYVKWALRQWNERYEKYLKGEITLDELKNSPARPTLLAKVYIKDGDLQFTPATPQDTEKLWKAAERLRQMWGDPDIPTELVAPYQLVPPANFTTLRHGFDKWFKLFNPRQLLTLTKLVKLIREVGKKVEEEKLKQGWSRDEAFKHAGAVTTYLAIALTKYTGYNSMMADWNQSLIMGHTLSMRGITMMWNWYDMAPWTNWTGSYLRNLSTLINSIQYLLPVSSYFGEIKVLLDDATTLSKLGDEKFDVIVTDPPYAYDVAYAELSDFYFVWLKRALSDNDGESLRPRFLPEAFFDELGLEIPTQWQIFAPREVSENEGRWEHFGLKTSFGELLAKAFSNVLRFLKDDGLLITYYAHMSPEAWEALLEAGWLGAGLRITAAHCIVTESAQRVTARGKTSLNTSIVAVWRKGVSGEALADQIYAEAVKTCAEYADRARRGGLGGADLFVATLGCVLSKFTQYKNIVGVGDLKRQGLKRLVREYIYPAAAESIARSLGAYSGTGNITFSALSDRALHL